MSPDTTPALDDTPDAATSRPSRERICKSSAVRRHFAQYARQDEMSDELELDWDCGIW